MNKNILRYLAPLALSVLGAGAASAGETEIIENPTCGISLPGNSSAKNFIIKGDVNCAYGDLKAGLPDSMHQNIPSAAVNIWGDDITVTFEGDIYCNGGVTNAYGEPTDSIDTIGIWVRGNRNIIKGNRENLENENSHHPISNIIDCSIAIEVGEALSKTIVDSKEQITVPMPQPEAEGHLSARFKGHNLIEQFVLVNCSAGLRLLNNFNLVRHVDAFCGTTPVATAHTNQVLPATAGFVLGIKAADAEDNASCYIPLPTDPSTSDSVVPNPAGISGNELFPSVYFNRIEHSHAEFSDFGFVGANEIDYRVFFPLITNTFHSNTAAHNLNAGFLVQGTGHILDKNFAYENGPSTIRDSKSFWSGNGIQVTLQNPACNYNFLNGKSEELNIVKNNKAEHNLVSGIVAVAGAYNSNSLPVDDPNYLYGATANAGTKFRNNYANGHKADLYDDNEDCAAGNSELYFLNYWKRNHGQFYSPECVGN